MMHRFCRGNARMATLVMMAGKLLLLAACGSVALFIVPQAAARHYLGSISLMQFRAAIPLAEVHKTQSEAIAVRDLSIARKSVLVAHEEVQKAVEKAQEDNQDPAAQKAAADAQK